MQFGCTISVSEREGGREAERKRKREGGRKKVQQQLLSEGLV